MNWVNHESEKLKYYRSDNTPQEVLKNLVISGSKIYPKRKAVNSLEAGVERDQRTFIEISYLKHYRNLNHGQICK